MKSNTIRLEEPLLHELYPLLENRQSLASLVRAILQKEISRHKQRKAAEKYVAFLDENPSERALLEEWESTDLTSGLKTKRGHRSTKRTHQ